MIRFDMKEFDFLEYRIKQILKDTKDFLVDPEMAKESAFLQILQQLAEEPSIIRKASFREPARQYLEKYENEWEKEEGLFRYNEWLKNKL